MTLLLQQPRRPTWDEFKEKIQQLSRERGEWGGYPVPVDNVELVVEPRYPFQKLNGMRLDSHEHECVSCGDEIPPGRPGRECRRCRGANDLRIINSWYSANHDAVVYVYREAGSGSKCFRMPYRSGRRLSFALNTLGVVQQAISVDAELRAVETLKSHVTAQAFKCYQLGGMFLETSTRSKVIYLFRKQRPTVALHVSKRTGTVEALCALCLHPIGYYRESYAGTMCPTDDVIAHLLMMRADERRFWAKSIQHPLHEAEAGV